MSEPVPSTPPQGKTLLEAFGLLKRAEAVYEEHPFAGILKPVPGQHGPGPADPRDWAVIAYHRLPGSERDVQISFVRASGQLPADHPELRLLHDGFEAMLDMDFQRSHGALVMVDVALVRVDPKKTPRNIFEETVGGQIEIIMGSQNAGHLHPVFDLRPGQLRSDKTSLST